MSIDKGNKSKNKLTTGINSRIQFQAFHYEWVIGSFH